MSGKVVCKQCSKEERSNQHRLDPLLLPITYESSSIITDFDLPRKYTSTHNDDTGEIYISIGHEYNTTLLSSVEARIRESQVIGEWIKKNDQYEIHLKVQVSTKINPNAVIRNEYICKELGLVLEGIAFAETALLKLHSYLMNAKIYIHFRSLDPVYDRVEYWHRIGYWVQNSKKLNKHSKKEIVKKGEIKEESVKKESQKKKSVKKERVKKEEIKEESVKKESIKKESVKKESVKKEDTSSDEDSDEDIANDKKKSHKKKYYTGPAQICQSCIGNR